MGLGLNLVLNDVVVEPFTTTITTTITTTTSLYYNVVPTMEKRSEFINTTTNSTKHNNGWNNKLIAAIIIPIVVTIMAVSVILITWRLKLLKKNHQAESEKTAQSNHVKSKVYNHVTPTMNRNKTQNPRFPITPTPQQPLPTSNSLATSFSTIESNSCDNSIQPQFVTPATYFYQLKMPKLPTSDEISTKKTVASISRN